MYVRRKVYSMQQPEEQLYSVTMTEEEISLFSDFCEGYYEALYSDEHDYDVAKGAAIGAGIAGAGVYGTKAGAEYLAKKAGKKANEALRKATTAEEEAAARKLGEAAGKGAANKTAVKMQQMLNKPSEWASKGAGKLKGGNWASKKTKAALNAIANNPKAAAAALVAAGGTAAGAGAGYAYKKLKKNKD